jgi:hypothetical protein
MQRPAQQVKDVGQAQVVQDRLTALATHALHRMKLAKCSHCGSVVCKELIEI